MKREDGAKYDRKDAGKETSYDGDSENDGHGYERQGHEDTDSGTMLTLSK